MRPSTTDVVQHIGAEGAGAGLVVPGTPVMDLPARPGRGATAVVGLADTAAFALGAVAGGLLTGSAARALGFAASAAAVTAAAGGYRRWVAPRPLERLGGVVAHLGLLALLGRVLAAEGVALPLVRQAVATTVLLAVGRVAAAGLVVRLRRSGRLSEPTLVLGAGQVADDIARALREDPGYGLRPVALGGPALSSTRPPTARELAGAIAAHRVTSVVVAFSETREHQLVDVVRATASAGLDVYVVPRFFDVGTPLSGSQADEIAGYPIHRVASARHGRLARTSKRALDLLVAGALAVAALPVLAAAALAVRASSPGPVLYRQPRIGQGGREFALLKFRTLYLEACSDTEWSTSTADAQTPVGRLLRRTNLDELPQLWNVLRGDMSLIGPRPERTHFVWQFWDAVDGYGARHRVPGGLTGWAQVNGLRGDDRIAERARFDNRYIESWSLWRDVVILLKTVRALRKPS